MKEKIKEKFNRINDTIKKNKLNIFITIIYAVITFIITIIFHEKWRDEAQAWLLARDLNINALINQMSYEGHPPLWHLILMPFAKLGFPYITESIISWIIMCITTWLILTKSPFKKVTQVLILASLPFIYLYPTISRSYCLIPLAITLIAIYYPERKAKQMQYVLSILLLAYTHVLMLGLVGILYLFFFLEEIFYTKKTDKDKKKMICSLIVAVVGLICLVAILYGSTTKNEELNILGLFQINKYKIKMLMDKIQCDLFGIISYTLGFKILFYISLIALIIWEIRKNPQSLITAIVAIGWQLYIYLFIYGTSSQKINTMFIILIFIAWIDLNNEKNNELKNKEEDSFSKFVITICLFMLILSDIEGANEIQTEIELEYSDAKETAQYIEENLEKDAIFICDNGPFSSAVIPYTENKKFWNPSTKEYFTYMTWNKISNEELNIDDIFENVIKSFENTDNLYLLISNKEIGTSDDPEIEKLQKNNVLSEALYSSNKKSITCEEVYRIYKINLEN